MSEPQQSEQSDQQQPAEPERCPVCGWLVERVESPYLAGTAAAVSVHLKPIGLAGRERYRRALEDIQELAGGSQPYLSAVEAGLIWQKAHTALKLVDAEPADAVTLALALADLSLRAADAEALANANLGRPAKREEALARFQLLERNRKAAVAALKAARATPGPG